jgi:hypothetical protein
MSGRYAVLLQQRIRLGPQRQHRFANGVADQMHLAGQRGRQTLGLVIAGRDRIDAPRHRAIDPAQHRILLMHRGRNAFRKGAHQRGERRITAEPDHGRRLERPVQLARHRPATPHLAHGRQPPGRLLQHEAAGRYDVRLDVVEQPGKAHPARVGNQRHSVAATHQLRAQRGCRNHVSAGSPGGEDVMLAHVVPHLTT